MSLYVFKNNFKLYKKSCLKKELDFRIKEINLMNTKINLLKKQL